MTPKFLDPIFQKIEDTFKATGWSQAELAYRAGVSPKTVSRILNRQNIRWSSFSKVCYALGYVLTIKADDE